MNILCDTCSVLMLIRIAPEMFCDERFECITVPEVIKELFQTHKFKTSYPWRIEYKSKIKAIKTSEIEKGDFELYLKSIRNIIQTGMINKRTGRYFNLSHVDQLVAACTVAHNYKLSTVDNDLEDFIKQEFSGQTISPLGIINDWLVKRLIKWDKKLQMIMEDWQACNEGPQPKKEIKRFEKNTGYKYVGPK
jgi:hypothetical protein